MTQSVGKWDVSFSYTHGGWPGYSVVAQFESVSGRIIAELERGAAPWVNVLLLWLLQQAGYRTPRYLTFKQARDIGGNVRRGRNLPCNAVTNRPYSGCNEHGTRIYFLKQLEVRDEKAESEDAVRLVPMLREYTVFNVDQCEGLPNRVYEYPAVRMRYPDCRDQLADDFLRSTGADIREGHGEALYVPSRDFVSLPPFAVFKGAHQFYSTAFHELTHWTGHSSRLDRDLKHRFGSRQYAAEELVAELGAAFLCAEFGFDGNLRHAGYLATWIELLKTDKRALFTAASMASQAAEYLRTLVLQDQSEIRN